MRAVFGLVLLIGMGLAGFAVYTVKGYFDTQSAVIEEERQRALAAVVTVDVYAPSRAMTYGELITLDDVQVIKYAEEFLPEGVFRTEEELFPLGTNTPRVVRRPMEVNEPILEVKVTKPGAPRGITALLKPGMRAYPLPDNVTDAFASELRPTDRIDIYWSGTLSNGRTTTSVILTGLEIIAVDEPDENGIGGGRGVVAQVTPEDFAALAAAQNAGRLSLTPVGTGDETIVNDITTDIESVLGIVAPVIEAEPEPEAAPEICTRTERRGIETVTIEIPCTDN